MVCAYRLTSDGHDRFVAILTGIYKPEPAIELALRATGGSWWNTVRWLSVRKGYLITGVYDHDPNYGDTPMDLDRRIRRLVGDWNVALRIHHPDGTVSDEETLLEAEINHVLASAGMLN